MTILLLTNCVYVCIMRAYKIIRMGTMMALEYKIVSSTHTDTSYIPTHIKALYARWLECPTSDWADNLTPAEKRTRTMRFAKFYRACEAAGLNPFNVGNDLVNE